MYKALLLSIFLSTILHAQEWAPIGAEWRHVYAPTSLNTNFSYDLVKIEKDTIIAGQACRKYLVYDRPPGSQRNVLIDFGFTYARNDSVFFWDKNRFLLRYDFSARPGDTITLPAPTLAEVTLPTDTLPFRIIVDSITNIAVGMSFTPLAQYHTRYLDGGSWNYIDNEYIHTIGGLSHWQYLQRLGSATGNPSLHIRCYRDDVLNLQLSGNECAFPSDTKEPDSSTPAGLYPNPVRDFARIDPGDMHVQLVRILDLNGRLWWEIEGPFRTDFLVPVHTLPPGYYTVQLFGTERIKSVALPMVLVAY